METKTISKLYLEDGTVFSGTSFAVNREVEGEVVFNTGMVGYPESLTDPSYCGQILVLTYPLIGNYGVPDEEPENGLFKNFESDKIQIQGLIICEYSDETYHWSASKSLATWLNKNSIPALQGIDTRALTKKLRTEGTLLGKISYENTTSLDIDDPNKRNLVAEVSITKPVEYSKGKKRIVLVDCGVKNNIIQSFLRRDITVIRVPWNYDFLSLKTNGIVLSNGPGDPKMCPETVENVRRAMAGNIPILGICLGSQILGLAAGARTYKLKYGHRSHNQPVLKVGTDRAYITSQNHGFAVDNNSLGEDWEALFININDNTNEGMKHKTRPFFSTQFHPEASGGPTDTNFLFDEFIDNIIKAKKDS